MGASEKEQPVQKTKPLHSNRKYLFGIGIGIGIGI